MTNRRKFLQITSLGALAVVAPSLLTSCFSGARSGHASNSFGIQLYTVRDVIGKETKDVLKRLAAMGYKEIESFEGGDGKGMFWGMGGREFASFIESLGMRIVASHCSPGEGFERKVEEAAEAGLSYLVNPWIGPQKTIDEYKRRAEELNKAGRICKQAGLKYAYHNHAYSFEMLENQIPQDVLMQNTDPELVDFEMDIYWVVTAGKNPIEWIKKYPDRFSLFHFKDRGKQQKNPTETPSVVLGEGTIDFLKILQEARKNGLRHAFVEQEHYQNMTSMEAASLDAEYMKKLLTQR